MVCSAYISESEDHQAKPGQLQIAFPGSGLNLQIFIHELIRINALK
jgi:hypothetical protein